MEMIRVFVGYDPREASAYHTFCDSVLRRASQPVSFVPLTPGLCGVTQRDASNTFGYSRFLVPWLCDFKGHAIYADGDMVCLGDIAALWNFRRKDYAVQCVKHDYETKVLKKYLGNKNENYPHKNWSSVMLFNCDHVMCSKLTPKEIQGQTGAYLHRFQWCHDAEIGTLPAEWNHLVGEYPHSDEAKILHYTLGTPCFHDYARTDHAADWVAEFNRATHPVPQFYN